MPWPLYKGYDVRLDDAHCLTRDRQRRLDTDKSELGSYLELNEYNAIAVLDVPDKCCFEVSLTFTRADPCQLTCGLHLIGILPADVTESARAHSY